MIGQFRLTTKQLHLSAQALYIIFFSLIAFAELVIAIIPFLLVYFIATRIRNAKFFFLTTFLLLLAHNILGFSGVLHESRGLPLLISVVTIATLSSFLLTYLWGLIFIKEKYWFGLILLVPLILDLLIIANEQANLHGTFTVYNLFVTVGYYLRDISQYGIDIFLLDYSGFAILFVNSLNVIVTAILVFMIKLISERQQATAPTQTG